ncbi:pentapeptide repeat-containing protein, partial [Nocardiopsis alba]|uniref:pentapeptide repeat-containing protein n=1 Tax=Nocardiopsis alba TaxID=53437 RepID=UPI0033F21F6B
MEVPKRTTSPSSDRDGPCHDTVVRRGGADLRDAALVDARLIDCRLDGARLERAELEGA